MSSDVVDLVCLRILSEIDKFILTKTLPHGLLDGMFTVDDIERCFDCFEGAQRTAADQLIINYRNFVASNYSDFRELLRAEYTILTTSLSTEDTEFIVPSVMSNYRKNINPVRALYYDARELVRAYNSDSEYDIWLSNLVQSPEFNSKIQEALAIDISRLDKMIRRYYWPMVNGSKQIPLELLHARQQLRDFRHYYEFFRNLKDWDPDN